jgi:hypothetical protein
VIVPNQQGRDALLVFGASPKELSMRNLLVLLFASTSYTLASSSGLGMLKFWDHDSAATEYHIINHSQQSIEVYLSADCKRLSYTGHGCYERRIADPLLPGQYVRMTIKDLSKEYIDLLPVDMVEVRVLITLKSKEGELCWLQCKLAKTRKSKRKVVHLNYGFNIALE